MAIFFGDDMKGWIYRVELYFSMYPMSKRNILCILGLSFEGRHRSGSNGSIICNLSRIG